MSQNVKAQLKQFSLESGTYAKYASRENLNTMKDGQNNIQNHFCLCVCFFLCVRADRWRAEEAVSVSQQLLPSWMEARVLGRKRGEPVKLDKAAVHESLSAPPLSIVRVNKPRAECWPVINTLSLGPSCARVLTCGGWYVPQTLLQ